MLQEGGQPLPPAELINGRSQSDRCDVVDAAEFIEERQSTGVCPGLGRLQQECLERGTDVICDGVNADAEELLPVVEGAFLAHLPEPALLAVPGLLCSSCPVLLSCKLLLFERSQAVRHLQAARKQAGSITHPQDATCKPLIKGWDCVLRPCIYVSPHFNGV